MINLIRKMMVKPVMRATEKFTSKPKKDRVFKALSSLLDCIIRLEKKKGLVIPFDCTSQKIIIFSDHHKGARNGADDFTICEPNYLAALDYYYEKGYIYIALGDCEELWENLFLSVKKHQQAAFEKERKFAEAHRFIKIIGNHDLYWKNDPFALFQIRDIYGKELEVHEGVLLQTSVNSRQLNIFCTHGHQGDAVSDGNWFSKFFVSKIWAPLQSFLRINHNTPAYDASLKTLHNQYMYEWSAAQKNLLLITGHTHQPVFESLTHIERLYRGLLFAREMNDKTMMEALQKEIHLRKFSSDEISPDYLHLKPGYFNTGCCCFNDGDITGIEIEEDCIRLIKWNSKSGSPERMILEEAALAELIEKMDEDNADRR